MCRDIFVCVWNYRNSYHGTVSFLPHSGFIMLCDVSLSLICLTAHRVQCWFTLFSGACRSSRLPITFSSGRQVENVLGFLSGPGEGPTYHKVVVEGLDKVWVPVLGQHL